MIIENVAVGTIRVGDRIGPTPDGPWFDVITLGAACIVADRSPAIVVNAESLWTSTRKVWVTRP